MTKIKNILAALTVLLFSATAFAGTVDPNAPVKEPLNIEYIGNDGNYLLFKVNVEQGDVANASFEINDKAEGNLFTKSINGDFKYKTIKIEKKDDQELDFVLTLGKSTYSKSFTIMPTTVLSAK